MIVHPCLRCSLPDLPIEVLRCPRCGEENFIPLNRTLSALESHPEPINETTASCDASTQQIGAGKDIQTGCSPNQYEQIDPMWKDMNFTNDKHTDVIESTEVEVERGEGADAITLRCRNTDLKAKQQLLNCSINPVLKNNTLQDIPTGCDQAYSFRADDNDVCDSASANFSASGSVDGKEPQNRRNFPHQPQSKWENRSSIEEAIESYYSDEISQFKNEDGEIDFAGCKVCHKNFVFGNFERLNRHQQSERDLKPYKCEKCLCRFSFLYGLNRHQVVHSEERPFKCDQCHYSFKREDHLNRHILDIHVWQKGISSDI